MYQLVWFRHDLRVHDNNALNAAMQAGLTLAVYVITPGQWREHDDAPCKVDFWLRNLKHLSEALAALNVPLLIRYADYWAEVPNVLASLCQKQAISCVHFNAEYGVNEEHRDAAVTQTLVALGISVHSYLDQLLFAPGSIVTRNGSMPKVFSQFRKSCLKRWEQGVPECLPAPKAQAPIACLSDRAPQSLPAFVSPSEALKSLWPAGEEAAWTRLNVFTKNRLADYHTHRDFPALDGSSSLSPYIASGVLSPRQCVKAALLQNQGEFLSGNKGVLAWIDELLWREFYKHILTAYPRVSKHKAFRLQTEYVPWRAAPKDLAAWQEGKTGFVLIDAAMRQLQATGWMHNRLRMVVAMFLSKNLLIDWREGERFFMRHLIDGDLAANNGGWQWSASTGTDSVPYFRVFNPVNQAHSFDPDGTFIRTWLPELAHLSSRELFSSMADGLAKKADYPAPMVDLAASRRRAIEVFTRLPAQASFES